MGALTNPQLKLNLEGLPTRCKLNKGDTTLEQGAFLVNDNIYEFLEGFIHFLTNPNVISIVISMKMKTKLKGFYLIMDMI